MKSTILAVCCAAALASGQWLERTFWLFDSFPELDHANVVFENPVTHRMYFTGWRSGPLHVYDPGSASKFGFHDTARYCADYAHCPDLHLIWLCSRTDDALVAYDDRADTVVRVLEDVVDSPMVLSYLPGPEKLYVASSRDPLVLSCDAATGAVLDSIIVPEQADFLVADSLRNRLYISGLDWDTCAARVLDCTADTLVAGIPGATRVTDMVLHPDLDRLYCLCIQDTVERNVVRVVDLDSLAVRDSVLIPLSEDWDDGGRLMPDFDRDLLWAGYVSISNDAVDGPADTIALLDATGDSLLALVRLLEEFDPSCFAVNRTEGKLYLSSWSWDYLAVIRPDGSVHYTETSPEASGVGWSPAYNQVFVVGEGDTVFVYDGAGDTLLGLVDYVGLRVDWGWWYPDGRRLYIGNNDGLGWLNGSDTLGRWTPMDLGGGIRLLGVYEERNRLYLQADSDTGAYIEVYDCDTDTVVAVASAPGGLGGSLLLPGHGKMFATFHYGDSVAVYDLGSDSVVATRWFNERPIMRYNPRVDRVYGYYRGRSNVVVVNPEFETVVAIINILEVHDIAVNELDNELWVLTLNDTLFVADCGTNQVVDTILLPSMGPNVDFIRVEKDNKVYCLDDTVIHVVRCPSRALASVSLGDFRCRSGRGFYNRRNDKLYISGYDGQSRRYGLRAVNCRWDSVVGSVDAPVAGWAWDSLDNEMYGFNGKQVSIIKDDPSGIQGRHSQTRLAGRERTPTLIRRSLALSGKQPAILLDITGRRVMSLQPGNNDIRHVAPGVYFVAPSPQSSPTRGEEAKVRKVVIPR